MIFPPVDPRPENLPLNDPNWSWEGFEAFCRDLISQFGTTEIANPYGRKGDFQRGIDIIARLKDGTCWVFQCKQYKKFTEADVKKAIEKATYEANRYILLLSCEASAKVIDEINKHSNWECWDVRDISVKVRKLDKDISRRLECLKIAETFPPFSASRRCYEELAKVFQQTNDTVANLDIDE
jgi:hypothetical protein